MSLARHLPRAPGLRLDYAAGALSILLSLCAAGSAAAGCGPVGDLSRVRLKAVSDGDTLVLTDGRRLRLVGVNTPELKRRGDHEPLAAEARRALQDELGAPESVFFIQVAAEAKDNYGRLMAHGFARENGGNLAQMLLTRGLGWRVAVPPNLRYQDCLVRAEEGARRAARGVWSAASASGGPLEAGFTLRAARIIEVDFRDSWWLETDAGFVARVRARDQPWFERRLLEKSLGRRVELRGWMYRRSVAKAGTGAGRQPWVLLLTHPSSLAPATEPIGVRSP